MSEEPHAGSAFPRAAGRYIAAIVTLGALSTLFLASRSTVESRGWSFHALALGVGLVFLACVLVHSRAFTLPWRGERISVSPDEAILLVAFVYLPASAAGLAALAGSVVAHLVVRRPLVKAAFTSSVYAASVGAAAWLYTVASGMGLGGFRAAIFVPIVVSALSHVLVAVLLTLLARERLRAMWKPELLSSITLSAVAGLTLGFPALALLGFHPLAAIFILPVGYAFYKAMAAEYRHQNELAVRRALSVASERIVGEPSEDAIADAVFAACRDVALMYEVSITLQRPGLPERSWSEHVQMADDRPKVRVSAPLRTKDGAAVGEFAILVADNGGAQRQEDQELASHIAGYLSIAFGTATALSTLARTEQRLRSVFNAARDSILAVGPDGRVAYCNANAQRLFDLDLDGGDVPRLRDLVEPASAERLDLWLETPHDESDVIEVEARCGARGHRLLELSVSPITLDDHGTGTLVIGRDITERRALEKEAESQREVLVRNDRLASLGILVAGVAHEVNNPLAFLGANIELAAEDVALAEEDMRAANLPRAESLAETRQCLADALEGVERLAHIAEALNVVAREQGSSDGKRVDLNNVLNSVSDLVKASVPIRVTLKVTPSEDPAPVWANPSELHQVVLNLTKNALEAVGEEGHVTVTCTTREDVIEVRVEDDGPGIPPSLRPQLFTPFYTTKTEGTGLGLPISHRIIKDFGGEIGVESEPGRGAAFIVTLPRATGDAPEDGEDATGAA